jgi:hypothetical protein
MRKRAYKAGFGGAAVAAFLAGVAVACGGGDGSDVFSDAGPDGTGGADATDGANRADGAGVADAADGANRGDAANAADAADAAEGGDGSSTPVPEAGSGDAGDAGNMGDAQDGGDTDAGLCAPEATPEHEPNDSAGQANAFSADFCGRIAPGTEHDFATFTLPAGTTMMRFSFVGNIDITMMVQGMTVHLTPTGALPAIPFVVGQPYVLDVTSSTGNPEAYSLKVTHN